MTNPDASNPSFRPNETGSVNPETKAPPRKRRRRWPYVLALLLLVLIALAALAPYLASTGPGTRLIVNAINGAIYGQVQLDRLSASWSGPIRVDGIRVLDPAGREVLRIAAVEASAGVLNLLIDTYRLGGITAREPQVTIAFNDRGELTLAEAFRARQPSDGPLPDLKGTFRLESGRVSVLPPNGAPYEIQNVQGQVALDTLSNWEGTLQLAAPGGGVVKSEISIRDLLKEGQFNASQANGKLNVQTLEAVDATAMGSMIRPDAGVSGKATLNLNTAFNAGRISLTGQGEIEQFAVKTGAQVVSDPRVQFAAGIQLDPQKEAITIEKLDLTSGLAKLQLTGGIDQYRTAQNLNLTCAYDAHWEPLVALLHKFVPATAELITIAGTSSSQFEVRGPVNQPSAAPPYRGLTAQPGIAWSSAKIQGLTLGQAKLAPRLADGKITIPEAAIPASGGTLNLAGTIDLAPQHPVYHLPGSHQVFQNIPLNPQLSRELLSRFNPIFADVSEINGAVSLALADVVLPLGGDFNAAAGSGKLILGQMQVRPRGFLNTLLELGSLARPGGASSDLYTIRMGDMDFTLRDGRIRYDNFMLFFAGNEFDLKFYGSVGLDGTLDLVVSVPVRPALLERFGVKDQGLDTARLLSGARVDIPVTGTRHEPRLDLAKVDMKAILARATEAAVKNQAGNVIGGLIGSSNIPGATQPSTGQKPARPDARKIGSDVLKGVLGGKQENKR